MRGEALIAWAASMASDRLSTKPERMLHTRHVVAKAQEVAAVAGTEADLLTAAAWLHDVGYDERLMQSGFHPLDGARYLRELGALDRLANLVARHSCAIVEAGLRGLLEEIRSFPDEGGCVRDALWYCDMTTGPDGRSVTLDERLQEIRSRYQDDEVVAAFAGEARPCLSRAIDRTMMRLRAVTPGRQL